MIDQNPLRAYLSPEALAEVDLWIAKYPKGEKQSAVMRTLMLVQEAAGYLKPEHMQAIALYLQIPEIAVCEAASFYSMYDLKPVGRHKINVCTNISCKLRGADVIFKCLQDTLGIRSGETTADGRFTLKAVECLAACAGAPMMQIDKTYHENLTQATIKEILAEYE